MTGAVIRIVAVGALRCPLSERRAPVAPCTTRRAAREERMREQPMHHAQRSRFDVSGSPREARPGIWSALAMRPTPKGA